MGCSNTIIDDSSVAGLETRSTDDSPEPVIRDIKPLLASLSNFTTCAESTAYPKWAKPPRTVACHSASVLNRLFSKKQFFCSEDLLLKYIPLIVSGLESDNTAFKQHLVFLAYKVCSKDYGECKRLFLDLGIFDKIAPLIAHGNLHFGVCASRTCELLYASDFNTKEKFYEASGIKFIISQISLIRVKHFEVYKRLGPLITLIVDDNGKPIQKYVKQVRELFDPLYLKDLNIKKTIGKDLVTFNTFLNLLLSSDT